MRSAIAMLLLGMMTVGCQDPVVPVAVLAQEDPGVQSLAVDGEYVYWTTPGGQVKRVSTSGGTPEVIATGQASADNLVVDATHVAWSIGDAVSVVEKASGNLTTIAAQGQVQRLSLDATSVYWTATSDQGGSVLKASKTGTGLVSLAIAQSNPLPVLAGSANILWANGSSAAGAAGAASSGTSSSGSIGSIGATSDASSVLAVPANGGEETLVVPSVDRCVSLATDTAHLVWADAADSVSGSISMSALDGTNQQTLSTGETNLWSVATDTANVYYSSLDGRLNVVSTNGGAAQPFVTGPVGRVSFALDVANIYWVNAADGSILISPKPSPSTGSTVDADAGDGTAYYE